MYTQYFHGFLSIFRIDKKYAISCDIKMAIWQPDTWFKKKNNGLSTYKHSKVGFGFANNFRDSQYWISVLKPIVHTIKDLFINWILYWSPISMEKSSQIHFKRKKKFKKIGLCKDLWFQMNGIAVNGPIIRKDCLNPL